MAIAFSAFPAYATFQYVQDRLILAERGVEVNAWVVAYDHARKARDTVVVRPDDPPYFEATLNRWPGDIAFNDRLDVVFDPRHPGRIVAVDEPLVDSQVLLFAGLDLVALYLLFRGLVVGRELRRRARALRPGDIVPRRDDPPARPRPRLRTGLQDLLTGWKAPRIVLLLVITPVLCTAVAGLLAASAVSDAAALRRSGVAVRAVVVKSVWDGGGRLEVRFPIQDGTKRSAEVAVRGNGYYEGDSVDVVHEPADPADARLVGPNSGGSPPWVHVTGFVAVAAATAVTVPTAVGALVRRARSRASTDAARP
ncbi:hypothetical protein GCM10023198_38230 [Promicromonospora umidemergens]|uniref:DUF3592 domain-containing protein n=1 Tax=Promicromonospora umidemergens TaxID=629679 RepID=A0ABP8XP39_9MICO